MGPRRSELFNELGLALVSHENEAVIETDTGEIEIKIGCPPEVLITGNMTDASGEV